MTVLDILFYGIHRINLVKIEDIKDFFLNLRKKWEKKN